MERKVLSDKNQVKVEDYLGDIVPCLFDVRHALEALESVVDMEKRELITHGQNFAYQQGILDVIRELKEYAAGTRNLEEETEELKQAMKEEMNRGHVNSGMERIYQ